MQKITITSDTTIYPIQAVGKYAGTCWGSDTSDTNKNYKRGLDCINSGHGRAMEFPQVYMIIDGYSARTIRQLYTHIGGSPTRLQASTRYINYDNFSYTTPPSVLKDPQAKDRYDQIMYQISEAYKDLEAWDIPKEDCGLILPLGMESKMVFRTNLRQLIDMSHERLCSRAYWEFRLLMKDLMQALSEYSEEWAYLVENYFKPKCEVYGYCTEKFTCGRMPSKKDPAQEKQEKEVIAAIEPVVKMPGFMESLRKLVRSYLT